MRDVTGLVDLLEVEVFGKVGLPYLAQQRFAEVQKLGFDKVFIHVRVVWMKVFIRYPV